MQTPYAFKLLIQELEAMGIQLRVNTEHIDLPLEQIDIQRYNGDDEDIANNEDIIDTIEYYDDYVDNFDNANMIKDEKVWKDVYNKHFEKKVGGFTNEDGKEDEEEEDGKEDEEDGEDVEDDSDSSSNSKSDHGSDSDSSEKKSDTNSVLDSDSSSNSVNNTARDDSDGSDSSSNSTS